MVYIKQYNDDILKYHHTLQRSPQQDQFPIHMHLMCELYYFISGDGYQSVEGTNYSLKPGSIFLIRDEETHCLHINPDVTYERMSFHFPFSFIESGTDPKTANRIRKLFYEREAGTNNMYMLPSESMVFVACCLDRIFDDSYGADPKPHGKVLTYLIPVLNEIACYNERQRYSDESSNIGDSDHLVKSVIDYISEHLYEINGLQDLEKHFYVSSTYMNTLFKKTTGTTIWDYIMLKRILNARRLLREGVPATEAAKESGFKDYSSFYRIYRKKFGVSPMNDKTK